VAGPSTANSIAFRWSRPPAGPLPDKYLILGSSTVASSVAGTVTSYRRASLTPATTYQYRVVAVRGGSGLLGPPC
jgi:Fibronectin type III domain